MKNHSVEKYKNKIIDYLIPIILSLVIATVLIWTELTTRSGLTLDDTAFHFHRFYDTYQQIQNHNFSYFQMNYGMGIPLFGLHFFDCLRYTILEAVDICFFHIAPGLLALSSIRTTKEIAMAFLLN